MSPLPAEQKNNDMVWEHSKQVTEEWCSLMKEQAGEKGEVEDADTVITTLRMALVSLTGENGWEQHGLPSCAVDDHLFRRLRSTPPLAVVGELP